MICDRDLDAAAKLMIKRHGNDRALQAAARADEVLAEGDLDGQRVWMCIIKAIETLQRDKPVDGEKVH